MIKKNICIKNFKCISETGETYNSVTGITSNGIVDYYTGQTNSLAFIISFPVLFTQVIDDIGFYNQGVSEWKRNTYYYPGEYVLYGDDSYLCRLPHDSGIEFSYSNWKITPNNEWRSGVLYYPGDYTYYYGSGFTCNTKHISTTPNSQYWTYEGSDTFLNYNVTITGESKIEEFRRYGKIDNDPDLYNPTWNTGFTQEIHASNGIVKQITGMTSNPDGLSYQKLYNYNIWNDNDLKTKINYSDTGNGLSIISYNTSGLTSENSINVPSIKLDYLIGLVDAPKINVDVFIDRGSNSSFDRHIKLGDINSLDDLERYGNGYYKIKED